jgi:hypothetical protein
MHREGHRNGLDAQEEPYKRFGCTGWVIYTVWMHRKSIINGLDEQGGPYKRFGCTGRSL